MKDSIFNSNPYPETFVFDEQVSQVFDDMAKRSIPFYQNLIKMQGEILENFLKQNRSEKKVILDLGCSTGNSLIYLALLFKKLPVHFIGIDSSSEMLSKARQKSAQYVDLPRIEWEKKTLGVDKLPRAEAINFHFTLQFIEPTKRMQLIRELYKILPLRGVLLLSEKLKLQPSFTYWEDFYFNFKKENGYSHLEISRKREALETVLQPWTYEENINALKECGFSRIDCYFRWYNWAAFIAVK